MATKKKPPTDPKKPPTSKSKDRRVLVSFAKDKDGNELCSLVKKTIAEKIGLSAVASPVSKKKTKNGKAIYLKGSKAAGSMKIADGDTGKYLSVPVPSKATIADMHAIAGKSKLKGDHFIAPDGGRYFVSAAAAKK